MVKWEKWDYIAFAVNTWVIVLLFGAGTCAWLSSISNSGAWCLFPLMIMATIFALKHSRKLFP